MNHSIDLLLACLLYLSLYLPIRNYILRSRMQIALLLKRSSAFNLWRIIIIMSTVCSSAKSSVDLKHSKFQHILVFLLFVLCKKNINISPWKPAFLFASLCILIRFENFPENDFGFGVSEKSETDLCYTSTSHYAYYHPQHSVFVFILYAMHNGAAVGMLCAKDFLFCENSRNPFNQFKLKHQNILPPTIRWEKLRVRFDVLCTVYAHSIFVLQNFFSCYLRFLCFFSVIFHFFFEISTVLYSFQNWY